MKFQSIGSVVLFLFVVGVMGWELIGRCLDENYDRRNEANDLFAEIDSQCPIRINSYITLKSVGYRLGRLEYVYVVNESGRQEVHLGKRDGVKNLVLQKTLDCPTAEFIEELNLQVRHVYQDRDQWQLLSFNVTGDDVTKFKTLYPNSNKISPVNLPYEDIEGLRAELASITLHPSPKRARDWFRALGNECPLEVSDQITLETVEFIGECRVQYTYTVDDAAVEFVNIDYRDEIQATTAAEMRGTRLADAIMRLDWAVSHVYKTASGLHVLSYPITRNELIEAAKDSSEPSLEEITLPPAPKDFVDTRRQKNLSDQYTSRT